MEKEKLTFKILNDELGQCHAELYILNLFLKNTMLHR